MRAKIWMLAGVLLTCGCGEGGTPDPDRQVCDPGDDNQLGPACSQQIATDAEYDRLSIETTSPRYMKRATRYMVPASDDPYLIPALVQNINRYEVHIDFLKALFLPDLTMGEYVQMVQQRETRKYYSGTLIRVDDPIDGQFYAFTAYTAASLTEALEIVEVQDILRKLSRVFAVSELRYTFDGWDAANPMKAKTWINPGFKIYFPQHDDVKVEVYTPAVNYGTVRLYTLSEFDQAAKAGLLSSQDLVVIDSVPFDIEAVVAGVVTGGRQWELSHVNVRMARRNTPNLYVKDALTALAAWEGKLVRFEAVKGDASHTDKYTLAEATLEEAQAWWTAHRPKLEKVPAVDADYLPLDRLTEMDVDDTPAPLITRFGGKAANLAKLYAFLDPKYQVPAFGIPFGFFERFLDENRIVDRRVTPAEEVSLREYVRRLAADPEMASDASLRQDRLWDLRTRIHFSGKLPDGLAAALTDRITVVMGSTRAKVKFRSSSNVEDALEFSGAGLYDSRGVCAADSQDPDRDGPSLCDLSQNDEQTIEDGLLLVWASLYNDRAWEERDWYQIPQDQSSMAVLVSLAFTEERANGVAFTGNPADAKDPRFLINAQLGDEKVVGNDPAVVPEKDLLTVEGGVVTKIKRDRNSVLSPPGQYVLTDDQLRELGALMAVIRTRYPVELEGHPADSVLLDLEFKIDRASGGLKLKQIRPFLLAGEE